MTRDHRKGAPSAPGSDDVAGFASPTLDDAPTGPDMEEEADIGSGIDDLPEIPPSPPPANVGELAEACVRFVKTKYGIQLDYTQDTLSILDHYLREARAEFSVRAGSAGDEAISLIQSSAGAYFGEVLRRTFGGMWFAEGADDGWRLDFTHVFLTVNPIGMVREALLLEAQEGWHAHLAMDPSARAEVQRRLSLLPEVPEEEYFAPTTRFDVTSLAFDALRREMQANGNEKVTYGERDYVR